MGRGSALLVLLALAAACGGGSDEVASRPWTGASALTGTEDHAFGVATDGTQVVFATGGSQVGESAVRAVPLDGSAPSRVVVGEPGGLIPTGALALDAGTVYLGAGSSVLSVPLDGGPVTTLATDRPATVTSLSVDSAYVWWTTSALDQPERAEVARVPRGGGAVEVVADPTTGSGSYSSVVTDGTGGAYAASPAGIVHAVPGRPARVVTEGVFTRIAFDGDLLFGTVAGGGLVAVPPTGGPPRELSRRVDDVASLAVFAGGVAFFEGDDLRFVAASGGTAVTVASGPHAEGALASTEDDVLVFPADRQVWKAVRPPGE